VADAAEWICHTWSLLALLLVVRSRLSLNWQVVGLVEIPVASICLTTFQAHTRRLWTLNEIAWPTVSAGTIRFTLQGEFLGLIP